MEGKEGGQKRICIWVELNLELLLRGEGVDVVCVLSKVGKKRYGALLFVLWRHAVGARSGGGGRSVQPANG